MQQMWKQSPIDVKKTFQKKKIKKTLKNVTKKLKKRL